MKRRLLDIEFPDGVKYIFIIDRRFDKREFYKAKALERRRGKKGRFVSLKD